MENQESSQYPEDADGNVHQKDGSPSETSQIDLNEQPSNNVSGDRAYSAGGRKQSQSQSPFGSFESNLDNRQHLRIHEGSAETLKRTSTDQKRGRGGVTRQSRSHRE